MNEIMIIEIVILALLAIQIIIMVIVAKNFYDGGAKIIRLLKSHEQRVRSINDHLSNIENDTYDILYQTKGDRHES